MPPCSALILVMGLCIRLPAAAVLLSSQARLLIHPTRMQDKRALRVLNMIVQLRQLVSEGRTREVELFARVRPGDPWLFGKLDEAVIVQHKVRCVRVGSSN